MAEADGLQTTVADYRAGWRRYRAWEKRFPRSTAVYSEQTEHRIYLSRWPEIEYLAETFDDFSTEAAYEKIAFIKAYLSIFALQSKKFDRDVQVILRNQGRLVAPHLLGFWFIQTDMAKFGAGASPFFQGDQATIFCGSMNDIDFADICGIIPFDLIVVRKPRGRWSDREARKLADHVREDLAFDVTTTGAEPRADGQFIHLKILNPDRGLKPPKRKATRRAKR